MPKPLHLCFISLTIALLALSVSFALTGFFWGILINVIIGTLWCLAIWRRWHLGEVLSLFFVILGISVATIAGGSKWLGLVSTLATLTTWDLSNFHNKLLKNEEIRDESGLIRVHLLRLSSVLVLGLSLPIAAFALTFEFKFWQVLLLGILLLLGLSQLFSQLKRSNT